MYYLLFSIFLIPILYMNKNNIQKVYKLSTISKSNANKDKCKLILTMLNIIFTFSKVLFFQKINKNVKKISKNTYELRFIINNALIKLRIKCNSNNPILQVIDDNDNDITEKIEPYFQDIIVERSFKPIDFNHHKIIFETITGDEKTFESNDIIKLD